MYKIKPHQKYIKCNSIALNMDITYGHSNELDVEKHVTYFLHTYIHNFHLTYIIHDTKNNKKN